MKTVIIISGGALDEAFVLKKYAEHPDAEVIAAEGGAAFCLAQGIRPTLAVGDFDTEGYALVEKLQKLGIPVDLYPSKKDETDTEIALLKAIAEGAERILVLGATGTRLDHVTANIRLLARAAVRSDACITMEDPHNIISVHTKSFRVRRMEEYPNLSLYAFSEKVTGLTLKGFEYPVNDFTLLNTDSVGTSNMLEEEDGEVRFGDGMLLMIRSRD